MWGSPSQRWINAGICTKTGGGHHVSERTIEEVQSLDTAGPAEKTVKRALGDSSSRIMESSFT